MKTAGWVVGLMALAGSAAAKPGDLRDTVHVDEVQLTLLDPVAAQPCALKSGLCIAPGARATIAVASAPVAAMTTPDRPGKAAPVVPRFARAAAVAAADGAEAPPEGAAPWTLELTGTLKRQAWAGNAMFLFYDLEDPESLENHQFTALFQAAVKATAKVAARVSLSPEDGFRAGHTYRVRVAQLINGREVVLAEGDLALQ